MSKLAVFSNYGKLIGAATLVSVVLVSSQLSAQGSATGWVVADVGTEESNITAGENSASVLTGPGSLNVINTNNEPGGSVFAQADFPHLRLKVDSTQTADKVVYGAAYFEDTLTVTGGSGSFEMNVRWTFNGGIQGAGGAFAIGTPPPQGGPMTGSAAVNVRAFLSSFGENTLDLSDPDVVKKLALANAFGLEIPEFDPFDPFGGGSGPSGGNFLFDEYDEIGNETGESIEGVYTDQNAGLSSGIGGGARFNWTYGDPLDFGFLLEGWASDGGIVDFSNTATLLSITIPAGSTFTSETGGPYDVNFAVPEPATTIVLLMGAIPLVLRRRKIA